MPQFLEMKITVPLPEEWEGKVLLAAKIAPAKKAFKLALEKMNVGAAVTDRTYTTRTRGGAARAVNFAVESVIAPPPVADADLPFTLDPA